MAKKTKHQRRSKKTRKEKKQAVWQDTWNMQNQHWLSFSQQNLEKYVKWDKKRPCRAVTQLLI